MRTTAEKKQAFLEEAKAYAIEQGGECLSTEYLTNRTLMRWRCAQGHTWSARYLNIVATFHWCPKCAQKKAGGSRGHNKDEALARAHAVAESHGGRCLSTKYSTANEHMDWQCAKGHTWRSTWTSVVTGKHWCARCKREHKITMHDLNALEDQKKQNKLNLGSIRCVDRADLALLTQPEWSYMRAYMPTTWHCQHCDHEWLATWNQVKVQHQGCPKCAETAYLSSTAPKAVQAPPGAQNKKPVARQPLAK